MHGQKVKTTKILLKRAVIGVVLIVFKGIIYHVCTVTVSNRLFYMNQVPEGIIYHVCTVTVSNRLFYMNQVPQKLY